MVIYQLNDERRRTKKGRPRGGSVAKILLTLPAPPCLGEALMRVILQKNILTLREVPTKTRIFNLSQPS